MLLLGVLSIDGQVVMDQREGTLERKLRDRVFQSSSSATAHRLTTWRSQTIGPPLCPSQSAHGPARSGSLMKEMEFLLEGFPEQHERFHVDVDAERTHREQLSFSWDGL